jgi:4-diphosphocytidyl-2C-methyl-D-erythritol kinase
MQQAYKFLQKYSSKVYLTGTGSCLFVVCDDIKQAMHIKNACPNKWQIFVQQSLNNSPLTILQ